MSQFFILGELCLHHIETFIKRGFGSAESLRVLVCSPGGDLTVASAFIDMWAPLRSDGKLQTIACGEVCSCAPLLIAAGSPGLRMSYPNVTFGMHEPFLEGGNIVTAEETRVFKNMTDKFYSLLHQLTGRRASFWRKRLTGGQMRLFGAKEARKLGLIDLVL